MPELGVGVGVGADAGAGVGTRGGDGIEDASASHPRLDGFGLELRPEAPQHLGRSVRGHQTEACGSTDKRNHIKPHRITTPTTQQQRHVCVQEGGVFLCAQKGTYQGRVRVCWCIVHKRVPVAGVVGCWSRGVIHASIIKRKVTMPKTLSNTSIYMTRGKAVECCNRRWYVGGSSRSALIGWRETSLDVHATCSGRGRVGRNNRRLGRVRRHPSGVVSSASAVAVDATTCFTQCVVCARDGIVIRRLQGGRHGCGCQLEEAAKQTGDREMTPQHQTPTTKNTTTKTNNQQPTTNNQQPTTKPRSGRRQAREDTRRHEKTREDTRRHEKTREDTR